MSIGHCPSSKGRIHRCFKDRQRRKKHVVSILLPCYTPNLFYRIQIGRIRRQSYKGYAFSDIRIFGKHFCLNKPHCFLMPRSIIHYQSISFPFRCGVSREERANRVDRCLIIELFRFVGKKQTAFRDNETTVGSFESAGKRLYCWCAAFLVPSRGYRRLYLEMDFVLKYKN